MRFQVVNPLPGDPAEVVTTLLDVPTQEQVFQHLGYPSWKEQSRSETPDGGLVRKLRVDPPVALPRFLRRLVPNSSSYRERQRWQPDRQAYMRLSNTFRRKSPNSQRIPSWCEVAGLVGLPVN